MLSHVKIPDHLEEVEKKCHENPALKPTAFWFRGFDLENRATFSCLRRLETRHMCGFVWREHQRVKKKQPPNI